MQNINTSRLVVYPGKFLPNLPHLPFIRPNLVSETGTLNDFSEPDPFSLVNEPFFELTDEPAIADYLLIPHNYFFLAKYPEVILHFVNLGKKFGKKILLFALGDSAQLVSLENSLVFRTSQYRSQLQRNEIIIPAFAPDLGQDRPLTFRQKSGRPVVGFCGWAGFQNQTQWAKYVLKTLFARGARKQGIYFRRRALSLLARSPLVSTNFLIRDRYSGNKKTMASNPLSIRQEYIENILCSDFVLAPKGDGNYSVRFYEALSLGRIPLLIDTETVLPLADRLHYDEFTLTVDYRQINRLPELVSNFYLSISDQEFIKMQRRAREAYEQILRPEAFMRHIFQKEFLEQYE